MASYQLTYKHKKQLEKDITNLSSNEYNEILNIIRNNKQKYSENVGGIYFNLKYINEQTIHKIIEFVKFAKNNKMLIQKKEENKKNNIEKEIITKINKNIGKKYTLDQDSIQQELLRLKNKNKENFSFQNFLDKLSVTNIKQFEKNESKIQYPQLKNSKAKFQGVKARVLKKCRDVNKSLLDLPFIPTDNISLEETNSYHSQYDSDSEKPVEHHIKSKLNFIDNDVNLDNNDIDDNNDNDIDDIDDNDNDNFILNEDYDDNSLQESDIDEF